MIKKVVCPVAKGVRRPVIMERRLVIMMVGSRP